MKPTRISILGGYFIFVLVACSTSPEQQTELRPPNIKQPPTGVDRNSKPSDAEKAVESFVSADDVSQDQDPRIRKTNATTVEVARQDEPNAGTEERTVEQGDIYRLHTESGHVLNLNRYRGFQIIDFSTPETPEIVGRVPVVGEPVEMYQIGDRAYILLNHWHGYWAPQDGVLPEQFRGGFVAVVDMQDLSNPEIVATATIPGYIHTSRVTRGNGQEALFAITNNSGKTLVTSFQVSDTGKLEPQSQIDLGGYVVATQATATRFMVARTNWKRNRTNSEVAIIDISDPSGKMVEGQSIPVKGRVQHKSNMDIHNGILRVVSGNTWNSQGNTNYLETFQAKDIHNIRPVDSAQFGDNENLFATLFLQEKAFFVTFRRIDPYHTFAISSKGDITPMSEFKVTGWNDFFKPVLDNTRIIGVGKNETEQGWNLAISLYDIEDLKNLDPLLKRKHIDQQQWSWSEANWDDRAFSVLENATEVTSEDGVTETGLILLPFSGRSSTDQTLTSGTQIFTFSRSTLTRRGQMLHSTPVRRSFVANAQDNLAGNLSDSEFSLFNTADPDSPKQLGQVDLAPNYVGFWVVGEHGIRHRKNDDVYGWWWKSNRGSGTNAKDSLEVVLRSQNIDSQAPIAAVEIPAGSQVLQLGDRFAVIHQTEEIVDKENMTTSTTVALWSFATPERPKNLGSMTTNKLPSMRSFYSRGCKQCFTTRAVSDIVVDPGKLSQKVIAVDNALVFPNYLRESEIIGTTTIRVQSPANTSLQCSDAANDTEPRCFQLGGQYACYTESLVDGTTLPETCLGRIHKCEVFEDKKNKCIEVKDLSTIELKEITETRDRHTSWSQLQFHIVDASKNQPTLGPVIEGSHEERAVGYLPQGSELLYNYKLPAGIDKQSKPLAKYYFKRIDLSVPSVRNVSEGINIPGKLIAFDGTTAITLDSQWSSEQGPQSSVNKVVVQGTGAELQGTHDFPDRIVSNVKLDNNGHAIVSNRTTWYATTRLPGVGTTQSYLTILSLDPVIPTKGQPLLPVVSELPISSWASFRDIVRKKALFSVAGGMLIVNLEDQTNPYPQAFFPMSGWPSQITSAGRSLYLANGRYGLVEFDVDQSNLAGAEQPPK